MPASVCLRVLKAWAKSNSGLLETRLHPLVNILEDAPLEFRVGLQQLDSFLSGTDGHVIGGHVAKQRNQYVVIARH